MAVHAGERAQETGTFHCRDCDGEVRVRKGARIPECPCGGSVYNRRTKEPRTRTATRKRKSAKKRTRARTEVATTRTPARATVGKRTTTRAMARRTRANVRSRGKRAA